MDHKQIVVYTDGSQIGKGPKSLCGYGIFFPNQELKSIGKPFTHLPLTNQRAELYAIYKALKLIIKKLTFDSIKIFTDSEYSIKSLTIWVHKWRLNGWRTANKKPVENTDIIKKIDAIIQQYPNKIFFEHVRSHTGKPDEKSINNDQADKLAKQGAFAHTNHQKHKHIT